MLLCLTSYLKGEMYKKRKYSQKIKTIDILRFMSCPMKNIGIDIGDICRYRTCAVSPSPATLFHLLWSEPAEFRTSCSCVGHKLFFCSSFTCSCSPNPHEWIWHKWKYYIKKVFQNKIIQMMKSWKKLLKEELSVSLLSTDKEPFKRSPPPSTRHA